MKTSPELTRRDWQEKRSGMDRVTHRVALATICVLSLASTAVAQQNTSAGGAVDLTVGQVYILASLDATTTQRWFAFQPIEGRSYCIEAVAASTQDVAIPSAFVTLWGPTGLTQITSGNADSGGLCWLSDTSFNTFIEVQDGSTVAATYAVRIVETTLYSNWFFVGGDYSAFTLFRNTTASPVSYVINWRNSAGAIVGSQSGTLPPNGSAAVDARSISGALAAVSGTVEIAHTAPIDSIMATTTTLSATTGLSFDTSFFKHTPW